MQITTIPKRVIRLVLAATLIPFVLGYGAIVYEIFINNAIGRAQIEAIAVGILGAIWLGIALLGGVLQRPLVFASYLFGIYATGSSAIILFMLSQPWIIGFHVSNPWLAIVLFSLTLAGAIALNIRYRRMVGQGQVGAVDISPYLALVLALKRAPHHSLWGQYDPNTDTLAIHFTVPDTPNVTSDSEMPDDDVIVRYNDAGEVIGLTILHANSRSMP